MHAGFSSGDRQRLRKALTRVRRARPFRRLQALLWLAEGRSISEVARLARASRVSIYNWCTAYQQAGRGRKLAALLEEKPRSGRPRQLGPQAEQVLQSALAQSPLELQYQSPGWTLALLATHLQKCCGGQRREPRRAAPAPARLELALETAPLRLSAARSATGQKKRAILKRLAELSARARIFLFDETALRLWPPLRAAWARLGHQARVPVSGRNDQRSLYCALNLRTGRRITLGLSPPTPRRLSGLFAPVAARAGGPRLDLPGVRLP